MAEQIECVGGPLDGVKIDAAYQCSSFGYSPTDPGYFDPERPCDDGHIYHYNPTTNTYEYKGVRK